MIPFAVIRGVKTLLLVAVLSVGCRKSTPAAPPQPQLASVEIQKDGAYLFTYVTPEGSFATTEKIDEIPQAARKLVRVIDPTKKTLAESASVYVVDLRMLLAQGKAPARPLSREAFETGALAQLPPGESSRRGDRPHDAVDTAAADSGVTPDGTAVVTIYGTSWCPSCKAARQYLTGRKIPFIDKDIERDPAAARELADKAMRLGVPSDRVPVLDVRGRLLIGFDKARLESLLGEPT